MHNIQRLSLSRAKLYKKKKTLSDKKQTHLHTYHTHLIGSHLGWFINKEKLHQNTQVNI